MTITTVGLALVALVLSGNALVPTAAPDAGKRVESDSDTGPIALARCITYNINRKMPDLQVRNRAGDAAANSIYLVLTRSEQTPTTFGVIRVEQSATGSHLTTWLPERSLSAAPDTLARRLVAGC